MSQSKSQKRKIELEKARFFRALHTITQVNTLTKLEKVSGIQRRMISKILRDHDPELYIELSGFDIDYIALEDIKRKELDDLDLTDFNPRFVNMVELIRAGEYNKVRLAFQLGVTRRHVYRMIHKLNKVLNERNIR